MLYLCSFVQKVIPEDPEIYALITYWKGEASYELRKFGEAVKTFEKFLTMPGARNTKVYNFANYALAYAALRMINYTKAANYFERFLNGNDKDQKTVVDATIRLADSYFVSKSYGSALVNYNKIINQTIKRRRLCLVSKRHDPGTGRTG